MMRLACFLSLLLIPLNLQAEQQLTVVDNLGGASVTVPVEWNAAGTDADDGRPVSISALQAGDDSTFHLVMVDRKQLPQTASSFLEAELKQQDKLILKFRHTKSGAKKVDGLTFATEQYRGVDTSIVTTAIHVFVAIAEDEDHIYLLRGKFRGDLVEGYSQVFHHALDSFRRASS